MDYSNIEKQLKQDLEQQSWAVVDLNISPGSLNECCDSIFKGENHLFTEAKIKQGEAHKPESRIRKSQISWVDNWSEYQLTADLNNLYADLIKSLNAHFYLSMKSYESQFAYYKTGDFYKKHIDQYKNKSSRQLTSVLFLNDSTDGGDLVIYNKVDPTVIDAQLKPKAGLMIFFFSGHIYHEVLPVKQDRYSLTTWFRDDEDVFKA